jgi:maltooligosyltrehalose trehalohydrolase
MQQALPSPIGIDAFLRCKLDWLERERNVAVLALHRDLLALRRNDPAFRQQRADRVFGAVLGAEAFVLRFRHEDGDRLLLVNLGRDLLLAQAPEPLLAPPTAEGWTMPGARRTSHTVVPAAGRRAEDGWHLPGHAAVARDDGHGAITRRVGGRRGDLVSARAKTREGLATNGLGRGSAALSQASPHGGSTAS